MRREPPSTRGSPWLVESKQVVDQLPDDATIEDAIERLYFLAQIESRLQEADAGLTVPHDEAKKRLVGE